MITELEKELAQAIHSFLKEYGKRDRNEPEEWSSPDACLFEAFALALITETKPTHVPYSSWGSGGYGPYMSQEGRVKHDELLQRCKEYIKG